MIQKLISALLFLAAALSIPLSFERLVHFLVSELGIGWVNSTIILRIIVILLFTISLKNTFALISATRSIRSFYVMLIAIIPGFGISFISPIYTTDYGMLDDHLKLTYAKEIEQNLTKQIFPAGKLHVVAFFTLSCNHCEHASQKLGLNQKGGQKIPVIALFPASEGKPDKFLKSKNGEHFTPYSLTDDQLFVKAAGAEFPSIFLINSDGTTLRHWKGDNLNYTALDYLKSLEQ